MLHTGDQDTLYIGGQDALHTGEQDNLHTGDQDTLHTGGQDTLHTGDQDTSCSNNSNLLVTSVTINSVGIIDGTEIFIQRPSNLETQKSSFSDYKSHTTVKYLVAIDTFTGVFTWIFRKL